MTPWVTRLLVANVIAFFVGESNRMLKLMLAFRAVDFLERPWSPLTYMFMHADLSHLFFNMIGLYFFGPHVEARLGSRAFFMLYLISGLVGAALSVLTPGAFVIGASGAVYGIMFAFARFWPREQILVWFVPVEARVLVIIMTVMSLFFGLRGGGGIAHYAHLGGFVGAYIYLKLSELRSPRNQFRRRVETLQPPSAAPDVDRWAAISREGLHPLNLEELDRLQAKIAATGVRSLTPDERAFLDRLSLRSPSP